MTTPRPRRTWTALITAAATATLPGTVLATTSPLHQETPPLTRPAETGPSAHPVNTAGAASSTREGAEAPALLSAGSVELQARLDGSSLSAGFTDTSDPGGPVRYGPAEAVLHVPAAARTVQPPHHSFPADPGDPVWTLPAATTDGLPRVALSTRGVDRAEVSGRVGLGLESLTGPGEVGVFVAATGDRPPSVVRWNSRDGLPDVHEYPPDRDERLTWSFSAEGTYCLGVRTTATLGSGAEVTGLDVLTVVVGDVSPDEVRACGEDGPSPQDPVFVLDQGHVDAIYPRLVDGELRIQLRDGSRAHDDEEVMREFDDVVLHANPASRTTIPEGAVAEWLGRPAGDPMWLLPQTSRPDVLWAGWGSDIRWHEEVVFGSLDWRLDHVAGPGNLAMYLSSAARDGAPPVFVSRGDSPNVRMMSVPAHTHANWAFTEEGVYCLTFSASGTLLDGRTVSDRQRLTLAVGDVAADQVVPCGRSGPAPEREPRQPPTEPAGDPVVLGGHTSSELSARVVSGDLRLDVRANGDATSPTYHAPSDVVFHTTESASVPESGFTSFLGEPGERYWRFRATQGAGWPVLGLDTADVLPEQVDGGTLSWRVHDAGGPGDVAFYAVGRGGTRILDTVGGDHATVRTRAHGTQVREWAFVGAGTYCLDVEVSATVDGRGVSDRQLVTVVAGDVDPSTVTPCGRDDDGPPTDTPAPPPSDDLVVLDEGHVDVAARVLDEELRMAVKDGTTPGVVEWRQLEDVLFHANTDAETAVPDAPAYDFLGEAGDPVWILPQTQLEGVLWPGWNTEEILPDQLAGAVHWQLKAAEGPGAFVLYQDGTFGPNTPVFDSRDALPLGFDVPLGQHAHANWAFTAEGVYCLSFTMSATTPAGAATSDGGTLAVAVGAVDVASVPRCGEGDGSGPEPTPPPGTSPPPGPGGPDTTPPPTTTDPSQPGGDGPGGGPGGGGPGGGDGGGGGGGGLAWTGTGAALPLAALGGLLLVLGGLVWWFGRARSRTPAG